MNTKTKTAPTPAPVSYPDPFAATTDEERLAARRAAWERTQEARRAVTKQQLCKLNFDVPSAGIIMRAAYERVAALRAQIVTLLPGIDVRCLDLLPQYCAAMLYANDLVFEPRKPRSPVQVNAEAEKLWERLVTRLTVLAQDGLFPMEIVDEVRVGTGWRDRGSDLSRLATQALLRWEQLASNTTLKREDLARAMALSDELNAHMGQTGAPRVATELELERHQAITLAFNAYEELRRAVSFLRWYEEDAVKIAPSVHKNALQKRAQRGEGEGEGDPKGEPSPGGEARDAGEKRSTEQGAHGAEAKKEASKNGPHFDGSSGDDEEDVAPLGPDGKPLVPQDDPFAKS